MQMFNVKELSQQEASDLFKKLLNSRSNGFLQKFFEDAFQAENVHKIFKKNQIALSSNERSYYLVSANGRDEALFGINFNTLQNPSVSYEISSIGKIIEEQIDVWRHIKVLLEDKQHGLIPKCLKNGVKIINARISSKGGKRAFDDLANSKLSGGYNIQLSECLSSVCIFVNTPIGG